jgi:ubiquinone/menaquinone biosynthesis C-methylase UbiE
VHGGDATSNRAESRELWDAAARGWESEREQMWEWSRSVGEALVDMAAPGPGESVLEIAAGPGDTGFLAAQRIGPSGRLVSTDRSGQMLAAAERRAVELGIGNAEFRVVDAERMDLESGGFDVALCRWAYMLMAEPVAALAETRRVLRPGGRLALAVWGPRDRNPWNSLVTDTLADHGLATRSDPSSREPGMYRLSDRDELERLVRAGGFEHVQLRDLPVHHPFPTPQNYWDTTARVSPTLGGALRSASPEAAAAALRDFAVRCEPYRTDDGYDLPGLSLGVLAS